MLTCEKCANKVPSRFRLGSQMICGDCWKAVFTHVPVKPKAKVERDERLAAAR